MGKYEESIANLKAKLNSLLTAENTETITKAVSELDELAKIHADDEKEKVSLKDRIVDIVRNTSFKDDVKGGASDRLTDEPKDMEVSIRENVANIIKNRKK